MLPTSFSSCFCPAPPHFPPHFLPLIPQIRPTPRKPPQHENLDKCALFNTCQTTPTRPPANSSPVDRTSSNSPKMRGFRAFLMPENGVLPLILPLTGFFCPKALPFHDVHDVHDNHDFHGFHDLRCVEEADRKTLSVGLTAADSAKGEFMAFSRHGAREAGGLTVWGEGVYSLAGPGHFAKPQAFVKSSAVAGFIGSGSFPQASNSLSAAPRAKFLSKSEGKPVPSATFRK